MTLRWRFVVFTSFLLTFGSAGCQPAENVNGAPATYSGPSTGGLSSLGHPIHTVCTVGMVADIVSNVGGEHVTVDALMGPGVDPHLYKATPGDSSKLNAADLVVYGGLHLEGRMVDLFENLAQRKPAFAVTAGLEEEHPELLRKAAQFEGAYDPHVWFDVSLWSRATDYTATRLAELDPPHAADYRKNADRYMAELKELDEWCLDQLATVPEEQRVLVTAHDAFEYFGARYKVEVHGLQGISTVDEPDLASVNELVESLVSRRIKAIFVESSVPHERVETLIEGCRAQGHEVKIGGQLYSDAMGPAGTPDGTYIGMVRHNVEVIVQALK